MVAHDCKARTSRHPQVSSDSRLALKEKGAEDGVATDAPLQNDWAWNLGKRGLAFFIPWTSARIQPSPFATGHIFHVSLLREYGKR